MIVNRAEVEGRSSKVTVRVRVKFSKRGKKKKENCKKSKIVTKTLEVKTLDVRYSMFDVRAGSLRKKNPCKDIHVHVLKKLEMEKEQY